jgi:hypothetical protein
LLVMMMRCLSGIGGGEIAGGQNRSPRKELWAYVHADVVCHLSPSASLSRHRVSNNTSTVGGQNAPAGSAWRFAGSAP